MTSITHLGATKSVSSDWFQGKHIYTKKNLSSQQIFKYKMMQDLGIGVKLVSVNQKSGTIEMEGGHTIHAVVHKKIVGKQGLNLIWKDIERISQILKQKGIAHTDIKPANIAVKFFSQDLLNFRVFLIDNDDVVSFGDLRRVGTRGMNVKESWPYHQIVNSETDAMGFQFLKKFMGI